jgi:hypothetical protein
LKGFILREKWRGSGDIVFELRPDRRPEGGMKEVGFLSVPGVKEVESRLRALVSVPAATKDA